jgi:hypothetical protein
MPGGTLGPNHQQDHLQRAGHSASSRNGVHPASTTQTVDSASVSRAAASVGSAGKRVVFQDDRKAASASITMKVVNSEVTATHPQNKPPVAPEPPTNAPKPVNVAPSGKKKRAKPLRNALGEYVGEPRLTSLAVPTPSPADYDPRPPKSSIAFSILGKPHGNKEQTDPRPCYDIHVASNVVYPATPAWSLAPRLTNLSETAVPGVDSPGPKYAAEAPKQCSPAAVLSGRPPEFSKCELVCQH